MQNNIEQLLTKHICLKSNLGICNNLFGGTILGWVDAASAIFASELLKTHNIVTVYFGSAEFKKPIKEGNIIHLYGTVVKVGTTSLTLHIHAKRFDVVTGIYDSVMTNDITFVKIDEEGIKTPIDTEIKQQIIKDFNL